MNSEDTEEIISIAVKLPLGLQERILSFPFLHALKEAYPKSEIHLITPKENIEVLNLLPFKAYYHEIEDEDLTNIFDVHRYCANTNIFNLDIFINLTNSFTDACLGLGLRAKKRVGFSDNWKTLVLNHKVPRLSGHHLVEEYFSLFKELTGSSFVPEKKVVSRELKPIVQSDESYMAINLSPLRESMIEEEFIELISQFENQTIVLFASDEQVRTQMLMDSFIQKLPKKNTYINFTYRDWIELGRMVSYATGVITYSGSVGALASYVGTPAVILYENEDPQKTGPFYSLGEVAVMGVNNPILVHSAKEQKVLKDRISFKMEEVASKAFNFFRL